MSNDSFSIHRPKWDELAPWAFWTFAGPSKVRPGFLLTTPYSCVMNLVFYDRNCRLIDIWSFTLSENLLLSRTIWNLNYVDKVLSLQVSRGRENADLARTPNGKETTYPIITWYCMMNLVFYDRNCRLIDIWSFTCSEENKLKMWESFFFLFLTFLFWLQTGDWNCCCCW